MQGTETCPLCGRPFGKKVERHHLVPKSKGGRKMVSLHPICHRKIHSTFTEKELATSFQTIEALKANDDIKGFIIWISTKPANFYKRTSASNTKRK